MSTNTSQLRDDGAIKEGASIVADYKQQLNGEIQKLTGKIDGWRAAFQGQAATAFYTLENAWKQKTVELFNYLDNFVDSLTTTDTRVADAEAEAQQRFANLMGSAGL